MIELTPVAGHIASGVEQLAEHLLHRRDVAAYPYFSTELFFQVGCCREVVRVNVSLEDPGDPRIELVHPRNQLVGRRCGGVAGLRVVIKYAVD
ncbi:hypothetical protein D3C81_1605240 [compost metagenome]